MYVFRNANSRTQPLSPLSAVLPSKTGHSQNYGTVGGFLAMTMAENASLQRGVVMYREYPQTRSAMRHFGKRNPDCANALVISGEPRGIETGKDFCQGMKYQP